MALRLYRQYLKATEHALGKGETSEGQLEAFGKLVFPDFFVGVFAKDEIPDQFEGCIIANTHTRDKGGEHWVAIAALGDGTYMVYDSYGRKATELMKGINLDTIDTDLDAEQSKKEENCGARCFAWLLVFDELGPEEAIKI